ncbi:hypothetical protein CO005_02000 [Candidatus Roizmanbacteria bacterium CG_4_8_14_3_um_filter_34_9]|uniref:Uncharacterized protein n=3 Tax=Candidatus Roizmaniibacteriota TaxID=1752723 RepID=A0A2M7AUZ5_9BACT|nr:MAG: hypothetical protein COT02_02380 [Candidatus Roizmanbacteria bacterium CG07_land_8_20_14_0_80_34_15]PIU74460.1 MAG: hypothetical protein COS77_01445 [Candidatus Roizmanbacteria bacterium CG06_land_8_20_14_3_00_34_14]PIW73342.1 MAG: hypothetical protein CO005_02000 [Candidatus Roizmanbacteria bacterium CG_4_8_14_3_um_filter_34_9]
MLVFLLLIIAIYIVSRLILKELFILLRKFFQSDFVVFSLVSLLFLPGTIIHESAHFITALLLILPVKSMTVFPKWDENEIKLGEVLFIKKDFLRAILVGVAPVFFGIGILFSLFYFHIYPANNIGLNIFYAYLIFSISANMFSSKQDLKDLLLIIPVILLIIIIIYVFNIKINMNSLNVIMNNINRYIFFVLLIDAFLFGTTKLLNYFIKR